MGSDDGGDESRESLPDREGSDPPEVVDREDAEAQDARPAAGRGGQLSPDFLRQLSVHYGPLPTPEDFAGYEEALPGAADRILSMAEEESRHRRGVVDRQVDSDIASEKRGQWLAFALSLAVLGAATYLMANGMAGWGFAMFLFQFLGVAGAYVAGRRQVGEQTQGEEEEEETDEQLSLVDEAEARDREENAGEDGSGSERPE